MTTPPQWNRDPEADRAQRGEPVDPDWQDDADMYRDAAAVVIPDEHVREV